MAGLGRSGRDSHPRGIYFVNCKYGLRGPIEVFSRRAVRQLGVDWQACRDQLRALCQGPCPWGEAPSAEACAAWVQPAPPCAEPIVELRPPSIEECIALLQECSAGAGQEPGQQLAVSLAGPLLVEYAVDPPLLHGRTVVGVSQLQPLHAVVVTPDNDLYVEELEPANTDIRAWYRRVPGGGPPPAAAAGIPVYDFAQPLTLADYHALRPAALRLVAEHDAALAAAGGADAVVPAGLGHAAAAAAAAPIAPAAAAGPAGLAGALGAAPDVGAGAGTESDSALQDEQLGFTAGLLQAHADACSFDPVDADFMHPSRMRVTSDSTLKRYAKQTRVVSELSKAPPLVVTFGNHVSSLLAAVFAGLASVPSPPVLPGNQGALRAD
ncbi:unnamed protein product [Prorocentrum cordatum]|uniref:Uncharacterized protein n=1 Tax=Prorocentrum cordatum TaxID=2364126 RepID=A0ABN9XMS5_9DINO|nr:unnamed protein product [Polarella glacialis]